MMKKRGLSKRILAFMLSFMMVIALVPMNAITVKAEGVPDCQHCGGTGKVCSEHKAIVHGEGSYENELECHDPCKISDEYCFHGSGQLVQCEYCEKNGHTYGHTCDWVYEHYVVQDGKNLHISNACSMCGKDAPDNAKECNTSGENGACSVCGYKVHEHDYNAYWYNDNWHWKMCIVCSEGQQGSEEIHSYSNWNDGVRSCICGKTETCTHNGATTGTCSTCGKVLGSHTHSLGTPHAKVDATCNETGTLKYWECSGCDKNINDSLEEIGDITIPATGIHDFSNGACSYCGFKAEAPAHTHTKGTYHAPVAATCTNPGVVEYWDCSCGEKLDASGNVLASTEFAATGTFEYGDYKILMLSGYIDNGDGNFSCQGCEEPVFKNYNPEIGYAHLFSGVGVHACWCYPDKEIHFGITMKNPLPNASPCPHCYKGKVCRAHVDTHSSERYDIQSVCDHPCRAVSYDEEICADGPMLDITCEYCRGTGIDPYFTHDHEYTRIVYKYNEGDYHYFYCSYGDCNELAIDPFEACNTDGENGACSVCGHNSNPSPSHTHTKDETRHHEAKTATCIEAGSLEYWDCSCGEKLDASGNVLASTEFAATGTHDFSTQPYINDGSGNHYQECKVCNAKSTNEAHLGGTATCIARASCEKCGVEYGETGAHSFTNYTSNDNATCTADGTEKAKCDNCDATDTRTKEGSKKPHSFTNYVSNNDATCTADGTKTATCENCSATDTKSDEGTKLDHNWGSWDNGTRSCTLGCGTTEDHTGHTGGTATCTTKAVCATCKASYGEFADHSYSSYVSNGDAKCLVDGTEKATCTVCGHENTRTEVNSALGHSWGEYSNGTRSCTRPGCEATDIHTSHTGGTATCTTKAVCRTCGASYGELAAHSFTNYISDNNATCVADGTKTAKCDRCDATDTKQDTGSKIAHSFTNYVSNNNATCTADGTKTATCENCSATDTKSDAGTKLGHKYGAWNDGTRKCSRCSSTETCKHSNVTSGTCATCGKKIVTEEPSKKVEEPSKKVEEPTTPTQTPAQVVEKEKKIEVKEIAKVVASVAEVKAAPELSSAYNFSVYTTIPGFSSGLSKIVSQESAKVPATTKSNNRRKSKVATPQVVIYTAKAVTFSTDTAKAVSNSKVDVVYMFMHEGHLYKVTIPAGTDVTKIIEKNGYSGPLYIGARLGTSQLIK